MLCSAKEQLTEHAERLHTRAEESLIKSVYCHIASAKEKLKADAESIQSITEKKVTARTDSLLASTKNKLTARAERLIKEADSSQPTQTVITQAQTVSLQRKARADRQRKKERPTTHTDCLLSLIGKTRCNDSR